MSLSWAAAAVLAAAVHAHAVQATVHAHAVQATIRAHTSDDTIRAHPVHDTIRAHTVQATIRAHASDAHMIGAQTIPAPAQAPAESPAQTEYRLPVVEVRGDLLTVDEVVSRAARVERESARIPQTRRFTSNVRMVIFHRGSRIAPGRREVFEEVARVEEGPGAVACRSIRIRDSREVWIGDSLVESVLEERDRERVGAQIEQIRRIPFALRRGLYRYRIIERRRLPGGALIHVAYRPLQDFAPLPEGEAWLDSRDSVVLRQSGSWTRNVPLPLLIRSIDSFSIRRSCHGPIWIEDETSIRITLRRTFGGPDRIELTIRLSDVSAGGRAPDRPGPRPRIDPVRDAVLDSLDELDRAASDRLRHIRTRMPIEEAARQGDSLLDRPGARVQLARWSAAPIVRYDRAQGAALGARVRADRGPPPGCRLDLEGAYARSLGRILARARIGIVIASGARFRLGTDLSILDGVVDFAGVPPLGRLARTIGWGRDPMDHFRRREATFGAWIGEEGAGTVECRGRIVRDRPLVPRRLRSLFAGRIGAGAPFRPIDPGDFRIAAIQGRLHPSGIAPWLDIRVALQTGARRRLDGSRAAFRCGRMAVEARPILPGGRRLSVRGTVLAASPECPRQERLYLGGEGTLRGYAGGALAGRNGYHVGGELFLNRDIAGWLPWVPDRGLESEAFLAFDHGRILWDPGARADGHIAGSRASAGFGFAWNVGLPGLPRVLVGIHRGLASGDRSWFLRLAAEEIG